MEEVQVYHFQFAQKELKRITYFVIHTVMKDTMELDRFVGRIAHLGTLMLRPLASSLNHTRDLIMVSSSLTVNHRQDYHVKKTDFSGIQNVKLVSIQLDVAYAPLTVSMDRLILEYHV